MADEFYQADGSAVDIDALQPGDIIYDAEGGAYEIELDAEDNERELAEVGKSAFFEPGYDPVSKSLTDSLREELSKAIAAEGSSPDREVIGKALEAISKAEERANQAEAIAKAERDLRLQREYIAKAAEYNVPVAADELGPVLMRMAESMDYDDCAVIHKALTTSGALLSEFGAVGSADNDDPFAAIEAQLDGEVAKSDGDRAHQLTAFFDKNPAAYDRYRAERAGR